MTFNGDRVRILRGPNKGKRGAIVNCHAKRGAAITIKLDDGTRITLAKRGRLGPSTWFKNASDARSRPPMYRFRWVRERAMSSENRKIEKKLGREKKRGKYIVRRVRPAPETLPWSVIERGARRPRKEGGHWLNTVRARFDTRAAAERYVKAVNDQTSVAKGGPGIVSAPL